MAEPSELDLTEAVVIVARDLWYESNPDHPIRDCDAWQECLSQARRMLKAAAPPIVAATRAKVAEEIKTFAKEAAQTDSPAAIVGLFAAASIALGKPMDVDELDEALAIPPAPSRETPAKHFVRLAHRDPVDGRPRRTIRAECICRWHGAWVRFRHTAQRHGDDHHKMWATAVPTDHIGESK